MRLFGSPLYSGPRQQQQQWGGLETRVGVLAAWAAVLRGRGLSMFFMLRPDPSLGHVKGGTSAHTQQLELLLQAPPPCVSDDTMADLARLVLLAA